MNKTPKKLEKGAVARMRETYKKLRENSVSKELEEALKKKEQSNQDAPKKIAGSR
jgi:hypothetical protein